MADETIKHNQIIEENVFKPAADSADILLEKITLLIAGMKQLAVVTGKKIPLTDPKTLSEAEQLAAALKKITDLENGLTAAQKIQIQAQTIATQQKKEYRDSLKTVTTTTENSTQALRNMQRELAKLPAGSKEFNDLAKRAGALKDKIDDAKNSVKAFASESKLTNAKTLFGQIATDIKNLDFGDAADKARQFSAIMKSLTFAEVIKGFKDLGSAFIDIGKALLLNPFTLIIASVAALAGGIYYLVTASEKQKKAFEDAKKSINDWAKSTVDAQRDLDKLLISLAKQEGRLSDFEAQRKNIVIERNKELEALNKDARERADKIKDKEDKDFIESDIKRNKILADLQEEYNKKRDLIFEAARIKIKAASRQASEDEANEMADRDSAFLENENKKKEAAAKLAEDNKKLKQKAAQEDVERVRTALELERKYNIEAFEGKWGDAEKAIAKVSIETKIALGIVHPDELRAYNDAIQKEKEKVVKDNEDLMKEAQAEADRLMDIDVNKKLKNDEKQKSDREKRVQDEIAAANQINDAIFEGLKERNDREKELNADKLSEIDRQIQFQQQLALNGEKNTLGELEKERAKALEEKAALEKKAQKQKEAEQLAELFLEFYKIYASKDGGFGAAAKATAQTLIAKGLSKAIAGSFAEGVEDFKGKGTGTSDSNIIGFSKGESVLTAKGTKETSGLASAVNERGYIGAKEWAMDNVFPKIPMLQDKGKSEQVAAAMIVVMQSGFKELQDTIKNKTEWTISENLFGEIVKARKQNGINKVTTMKNSPIINGK